MRIPAIINAKSGTADQARSALAKNAAFEPVDVAPDDIASEVRKCVASGHRRILIAGGDGTIAAAAAVLAGGDTEFAVLPGGTLNHFARDLGISTEPAVALETAAGGTPRAVDVGMVNDQLFLNTVSVGAYVRFVKTRERLEQWCGYRLASVIAAVRIFFQFRLMTVELEVEGEKRIYRTALVFIGVGERELQLPSLGKRVKGGKRGLHVIVAQGRSRARLFASALNAVARGVESAAEGPVLDSFVVDRCTISHRRRGTLAIDGELVTLNAPFAFELRKDALMVVTP
ncbi:MAG: diacylglycerol kinase family protein [Gemmatimonadota bacterium]